MSLTTKWRLWFFISLGLVAICLLGAAWEQLPFHRIFPDAFDRFYVMWWFFVLAVGLWLSGLTGAVLVLLDDRQSVLSRVIWTLAGLFVLRPLLLVVYWLLVVELPDYRARRDAAPSP